MKKSPQKKKIPVKAKVKEGGHDADKVWQVAWTYIRTVIDTTREPFLILNADLRVLSANKTFYRFFHATKKDTEGTLVYNLGSGQWNIPALRKLLEKILPIQPCRIVREIVRISWCSDRHTKSDPCSLGLQ